MESTTLLCSPTLLPCSSFSDFTKSGININHQQKRVSLARVYASRKDAYDHQNYPGGHRLVDENMIVLRKRIHEMKMVEKNYEPPENGMDWEKRHYTSYNSLICEAMGVLQSQLMNTRPSLALGMILLIAFSVPTTAAVVCIHLMEFTKGLLAGIHMV